MAAQTSIRGFLIDLDGTVVEADRLLPGADAALAWLKEKEIPYRFITNTTSKPRSAIVKKLQELGLNVAADEIYTAPVLARDYLLQQGFTRCYPLMKASLQEDLTGIEMVDDSPHAVLVGDIGDDLTYAGLNRAFRFLLQGAAFIALARNRYFRGADGLCLDVGAIVASLEYACQCEPVLIGKPAPEFFDLAARGLGLPCTEIGVIGDDLEADVIGGKNAGCQGILVRTGKFRVEQLEKATVPPDVVLDSLAKLPEWMDQS